MKNLLKKLHHKIPPSIQKLYMPMVGGLSYYLQKIASLIYPPVFIFEGIEKRSRFPLVFAYIGFHPQLEHYWSEAVLCEGFQKHAAGRCFFWDVFSFLDRASLKADFLLMEDNFLAARRFSSVKGFRVPYWVGMELDISRPFEKLFGSQKIYIQSKIRKNKLTYEMTKDPKIFDNFYYNMFVPYIGKRHASTVHMASHQSLTKMFANGELLLIKKDDEIVAGGLVEFVGTDAKLRVFGVKEGRWEYVRDGTLGAAYYFSVLEMKKRGYNKLDIGGARPLINDGVTRHKILLDARFSDVKKRSCLWLVLRRQSQGLQNFLINHPFIFSDKNRDLFRAIFAEIKDNKFPQELEDLFKVTTCEGIKETFLFLFSGFTGEKADFLKGQYSYVVKQAQEMIM